MARLNPCPSCRDAFSLSMFSPCAPDEHFVQNAPARAEANSRTYLPRKNFGPKKAQGLKPGFLLGLYGPTEVVR